MHWNQQWETYIPEDMHRIAAVIAERVPVREGVILQEAPALLGGELQDIISRHTEGEVNCYPGTPSKGCYRMAYFIYLEGVLRGGGRWPFNFEGMIHEIVNHCARTKCGNVTRDVRIITDTWRPVDIDKWRPALSSLLLDGIQITSVLVTPGGGTFPVRLI
ncbi:hypothetical protein [Fundidesulfovibrio soli]|uniref:hypothetical protein n=1 Tax=Fundidesulfovibrio soli TaxID=2922716 RepID=UPI001FAFD0BE|nr:hypothetical protein [Fundidesulfovibrio soli]